MSMQLLYLLLDSMEQTNEIEQRLTEDKLATWVKHWPQWPVSHTDEDEISEPKELVFIQTNNKDVEPISKYLRSEAGYWGLIGEVEVEEGQNSVLVALPGGAKTVVNIDDTWFD